MSDGAITLAYSRYFLCRPRPYLTETKEARVAKDDLAAGFIKVTFAQSTFV